MSPIDQWISDKLFTREGSVSYYMPEKAAVFESSCLLYSTMLGDNFLTTIIDGKSKAAQFSYTSLQSTLSCLVDSEACYVFYITDPDNCFSQLHSIEPYSFDFPLSYRLNKFELYPAEQGGASYLGLVGESRTWLLTHEDSGGGDFSISFFGSTKLVQQLWQALSLKDVDDYR